LLVLTLALMLESLPFSSDAFAQLGWYLHQDIKKWLPIGLPFSLVELLLLIALALWLFRGRRDRRAAPFQPGRLMGPIVAFTLALAFGVLWGLARGGDNLTYALFEIRGLVFVVFAYVLVGMLFRDDHDLDLLVWCVLLACTVLAAQDLYRYYFVANRIISTDLLFEHEDSLILGFGAILCLALLAFKGTRAQRRASVFLFPLILICLAVMRRRAAWPVLLIGLVILAILLLRARPKVFWRVVPIVAVLGVVYLATFWNAAGTLGQPARAIRSQISPDPRDANSDLYRQSEHYDIIANIRSSRVLGLGFGQPYIFYVGLPDLSFWPFWHYESHNSVLWLWMDGGMPAFFTFMWLAGSALAAGGQEFDAQIDAGSLAQSRARPRANRPLPSKRAQDGRRIAGAVAHGAVQPAPFATGRRADRRGERDPAGQSRYRGAGTALLAACACFIPMQMVYSYVDLGLVNPRDMLLYGVALGILGRSFAVSAPRSQPRAPGNRTSAARAPVRPIAERSMDLALAEHP
jgi:hypothetical protein